MHPQVTKIFHEQFFIPKFRDARAIDIHLKSIGINPKRHIWGDECSYYPNIRKIKVETYCKTLHEWYPKKFKNINDINQPLRMYNKIIPRILPILLDLPYVLNIKYEYLVINPDLVIPKIYDFCGVDPNIDFRIKLKQLKNKNYQELDSSRAFAFMKSEQKIKVNFDNTFRILDQLEGPEY